MEQKKSKTPLIRFPEFKEGWEHKQLNELLKVSKKQNTDLKYSKGEVLSVSGELGIVNQIEHLGRSYAGASVHNYGVVENGDIVYTKSPLKENPYGIIKLNKDVPGIVSTLYAVYKVKDNNADGEFIEHYFSLDANTNRYLRPLVRKGAKNDMKINNEYVLHDRIFVPKKEEQRRIAHFFNIIDAKISQLKEKHSLLQEYKKSVMQKIFTQEIKFTKGDGSAYPKWNKYKLSEIGKAFIGLTYSPDDVVLSEGVLVLRSSNIQEGKISYEDNVYVEMDVPSKNFVKENDILICARNGSRSLIGKSALITKNEVGCAFGAFMSIFRSKHNRFLYQLFQTNVFDRQVNQHLGATINQITTKSLNSFVFQIPCEDEMEKITSFLESIDGKIRVVSSLLDETKVYKKALLQQMFCY